jgi:hypothetical protein
MDSFGDEPNVSGEMVKWDHDTYNADRTRVRSTSMKWLSTAQGPRAYFWNVFHPEYVESGRLCDRKVGPMQLGTIFHDFLLEGNRNWRVLKSRRNSHAAQDEMNEFPDVWFISEQQQKQILGMRDGAMANATIRRLIETPRKKVEQTVLFDGPHGIASKIRLDILCREMNEDMGIWDLKTSLAESRDKFDHEVRRLRYYQSAALYSYGLRTVKEWKDWDPTFRHIVVSKKWPYYSYAFDLDFETYIKPGLVQVAMAYTTLAEIYSTCKENGVDPASMEALPFWYDRVERNQGNPLVAPQWFKPDLFDPDSVIGEPEDY